MNYKLHYDNLIKTRKILNRKKYNGVYYEDHHIIMKSMGGTDDKNNKLLLTAKEHYIAHYLLREIYKNSQTCYAIWIMRNGGNKNIRISSRIYEEIRIECSKKSSEIFKNQWNNSETRDKLSLSNSIKNKGRKHTDDSKVNMSNAHKGIKQSQETINKRISKTIGKKRTDEFKQLIIKKHKGKNVSDKVKIKQSNSAKNRIISEETKLEMSKKMSISKSKPRKQFRLISPNGEEYIFYGLKLVFDFAKNNGISVTLLKNYKNKGKVFSKSTNTENSNNWELISLDKI